MQFVWAIAMLVASYILQAILTPAPKNAQPSTVNDIQTPTVAEGTPQAIVFGEAWTGDWTVLWYGDFSVEPIYSGGGKK